MKDNYRGKMKNLEVQKKKWDAGRSTPLSIICSPKY